MKKNNYVLGGGVTGLAAGIASGFPVIEENDYPGGICSSYYIKPGETERSYYSINEDSHYRFELGGGHWIFGGDPAVIEFINSLTKVKFYRRRSSVFFSRTNQYIPYPLQNNLFHLGPEISARALSEMISSSIGENPNTLAEWLKTNFGKTLTDLFFGPFNKLYTAGLWDRIIPQDGYKSPVDLSIVIQGALQATPSVGYNSTFFYPIAGLNELAQFMAKQATLLYEKKVIGIDLKRKELQFSDGSSRFYQYLISTLPLNKICEISNINLNEKTDYYTSVLVLNIGACRGAKCPHDHWLYNTDTVSGFHRVGFYSNVDPLFLPEKNRDKKDRVSIYVEKAYLGGKRPLPDEERQYMTSVIEELREWKYIEEVEVVDSTWIEVAYTWSIPGNSWKKILLDELKRNGIFCVGRYGRWAFQGIADSIRDGLMVGSASRMMAGV